MKQAHIYILGMVQGVGFRAFIKYNARKRGLTGWVRNLSDGRLEAVLQGEKEKIDEIVKISGKGPFLADIQNIVVDWEEQNEEYKDFNQLETI